MWNLFRIFLRKFNSRLLFIQLVIRFDMANVDDEDDDNDNMHHKSRIFFFFFAFDEVNGYWLTKLCVRYWHVLRSTYGQHSLLTHLVGVCMCVMHSDHFITVQRIRAICVLRRVRRGRRSWRRDSANCFSSYRRYRRRSAHSTICEIPVPLWSLIIRLYSI